MSLEGGCLEEDNCPMSWQTRPDQALSPWEAGASYRSPYESLSELSAY